MSDHISLFVEDDDCEEKELIIQGYTYTPGLSGITHGDPDNALPPESAAVEDVEVEWAASGTKLTDEEFSRYYDEITEAIIDQEESNG